MAISNRIKSLSESQSLAMAQRCAQLRAEGVDVIGLTLGEPDFNTPDHIKEAAVQAVVNNYSHYAPVPGIPSLREAVSRKLLMENHLSYTPDEIIISVGAKQAICNAVLSLVNPGDEVILPTPCWVSYSEMVRLAEGVNVFVPTSAANAYKLTAEQLRAAITHKTRLLFLCSPNNPTGCVYSESDLQALAEVLADYPDIYIISDEIYEHLNYVGKHASLASFKRIAGRVVVINGVSKSYAMTGYRIGWLACHDKALVAACKKLQGQYLTSACTVAQKAAEAAYTGSQQCVEDMRQKFCRRRDLIMELLSHIPGVSCDCPAGAFYVFPDVSSYYGKTYAGKVINGSDDMVDYLLNEAHVACVSGSAFGEDRCMRLSYATSEDNIRIALARIKEALS